MIAKMRDSLGYTVLFTFLLTFSFVFGLSFLNNYLSETIKTNASLSQKSAVLEAMGIPFQSQDTKEIEKLYSALKVRYYKKSLGEEGEINFKLLNSNQDGSEPLEATTVFYEGDRQGERVVGVSFSGSGMWGTIKGVVSTNSEVTKTIGIQIISHSETPGLGARITSQEFRNQFSQGVDLKSEGSVILVKSKTGKAGEINAITGATVTSTAMNSMLSTAYKDLRILVGVNNGK